MKKRIVLMVVLLGLCSGLCLQVAYANTSWVWLSDTRPHDLLPIAIVGTLVIELFVICAANRINTFPRIAFTFFVLVITNSISFLLPYLFRYINPMVYMTEAESFYYRLNYFPIYIVGLVYLFLTLVTEVPIVYLALQSKAPDKKRLVCSVVIANVITTAGVSVMERLMTSGRW